MLTKIAVGFVMVAFASLSQVAVADPQYDPQHGRGVESAPRMSPIPLKEGCTFWPCNPHWVCIGWDHSQKCTQWVKEWDICSHCPEDWKAQ
jgi:hypothetical protein